MSSDLAGKYPETGWWLYTELWTRKRIMPTGEPAEPGRQPLYWMVDAPALCRRDCHLGTLIGVSDGGVVRAILFDPKSMVFRSTLSRQEVREIPLEIPRWEGPQVSSRSKVGEGDDR